MYLRAAQLVAAGGVPPPLNDPMRVQSLSHIHDSQREA
jgi:hypothetical protein